MVKRLLPGPLPDEKHAGTAALCATAEINALEERLQALDDATLQAKRAPAQGSARGGRKPRGHPPRSLAAARGSRRALGLRHFDVQLMGA